MNSINDSITRRPAWKKYDEIIRVSADRYRVPFEWVKATLLQESSLGENERVKQKLVSYDGLSWGLAQMQPSTASWLLGREISSQELATDDSLSIQLCALYLSKLIHMFSGDEQKVVMSYNQGQGATRRGEMKALGYYREWLKWLEIIEKNPA